MHLLGEGSTYETCKVCVDRSAKHPSNFMIEFAEIPLKWSKEEDQIAPICLTFSPSWLSFDDNSSKHFLFLSFQIDHTTAMKERFLIDFPLFDPILQYSNKDGMELGQGS